MSNVITSRTCFLTHILILDVVIIAMSALLGQGTTSMDRPFELPRALELRRNPLVHQISRDSTTNRYQFRYGSHRNEVMATVFANLTTNWMYSALIEATLNGSEPPWSKDGWSFIPLDFSSVPPPSSELRSGSQSDGQTSELFFDSNITVHTPALRGRLECNMITNTSDYMDDWPDLEDVRFSRNVSKVYLASPRFGSGGFYLNCCANTSNAEQAQNYKMPILFGGWRSKMSYEIERDGDGPDNPGRFVINWLRGEAGMADIWSGDNGPWLFFESWPRIQSLSCLPIIEAAESKVTVGRTSGIVQDFDILGDSKAEDTAWADNFIIHQSTDEIKSGVQEGKKVPFDVSTR